MKTVLRVVSLVWAGISLAAFGAAGDAYVWTGAVDGKWMNPKNWTLNGVEATVAPGVPSSEVDFGTSPKFTHVITDAGKARLGEKVTFGPIGTANTTIDLDGLYCIKDITIAAGAPTYTFGTSADQVLPLQSVGADTATSGNLIIEQGVENMPVLTATLCLGAAATARDTYLFIKNNTAKELVIGDIGKIRRTFAASWCFSYLYLDGTGPYRFTGTHIKGDSECQGGVVLSIYTGKVTVASEELSFLHHLNFQKSTGWVEIEKDCKVTFCGHNGNSLIVNTTGSCKVTGEGTLCFENSPTSAGTNRSTVNIPADSSLEVSCAFDMSGGTAANPPHLNFSGSGTVTDIATGVFSLTGENMMKGPVYFIGMNRIFRVNAIEKFGPSDTVQFDSSGCMDCAIATNVTFAKTFVVADGKTAGVANSGAGTVTAAPALEYADGATSVFFSARPETAPIVLKATAEKTEGQTLTLCKDGAGRLIVESADDLVLYDAIRLRGGTLDVSAIRNWSPSVPVTFDSGASTIVVPDGETYVFPSFAATPGKTAGSIDFVCGSGRVRVTGVEAGAAMPAGVTVNGKPAEFRDGGLIAPKSPATDVQIAARGDTVPHAPGQTVGITADGTGGNDTIAADATAVKALVHVAAADATVEIGEGRNLTAEEVSLAGFAGNLNVGKEGDFGTFGAYGKDVKLLRDDLVSDLAVRAPLAEGARVFVDGGLAVPTLAGGSAVSNSIVVRSGELKVSGDRTFNFNFIAASTNVAVGANDDPAAWPTVRFDGAKDVRFGTNGVHAGYAFRSSGYTGINVHGRLVFTNCLVRSDSMDRKSYPKDTTGYGGEENAIVVGSRCAGQAEIRAGATITNRLVVGSPASGHRGIGGVWQSGGEMAALGQYGGDSDPVTYGSGLNQSANGYGYYRLDDGRLVSLGTFVVGYQGAGLLHQTGGELLVTKHPNDTEVSPWRLFVIGGGNNAYGFVRLSGGTAKFDGVVNMCGGYWANGGSRAWLTLDGTAAADAQENTIRLITTGSMPLALLHTSSVNLNDSATLRAAGFCDQSKTNAETVDANQQTVVGFNGGTFVTSTDSCPIFHYYNATKPGDLRHSVNDVVIYEKGATVDTDGKTGNVVDVPLKGAFGGGVSEILWTVPADGKANYNVPPWIVIEGNGVGATAVAEWDPATCRVTGITITSAGVGYTWAKAILRIGSVNLANTIYLSTNDCVITDNRNVGSFTKKGEGDLTLMAANTYGGDTVLKGGVLRLAVTGALPNGSALVPQGGIVEVADGVELPSAITVKLDNPSEDQKFDLIRFAGEVPEALPDFTLEGVTDPNWRVRLSGKTLRAAYRKGVMLIVR